MTRLTLVYKSGQWEEDKQEDESNARLIAAAPDLLTALHLIVSQSCGSDWTAEQAVKFMRDTARAAIAKAEVGK